MTPYFDRIKAECEPLTCRALVGIGGRIKGAVVLAEKPELRADREFFEVEFNEASRLINDYLSIRRTLKKKAGLESNNDALFLNATEA